MTLTSRQISEQLDKLYVRKQAYSDSVHQRAVKEYAAAFGHTAKRGDHLDMCVVHNSIVSPQNGTPWREVNYSHMKRAKWLTTDVQFRASKLVDRWYQRKMREWQAAGCP